MIESTKFDPLGLRINAAIGSMLFHEQPVAARRRIMQGLYDAGFSGVAIGRALNVSNVYNRIDAHRGRGPARGLA